MTDLPLEVAVDPNNDIFVTGFFEGTVDFDPGDGEFVLSSNGEDDAFLSKFDPLGSFLWGGSWGGIYDDLGQGIAVDSLGNAYVCGYFWDRVDFDPGEGCELHCSNGMDDGFLSKFPPDGNW